MRRGAAGCKSEKAGKKSGAVSNLPQAYVALGKVNDLEPDARWEKGKAREGGGE